MADNYVWLDDERTHHEIYTEKMHPVCICIWATSHDGPVSDEPMPSLKLVARKKACPIHGAKGWL